jgi:hypothetical protein
VKADRVPRRHLRRMTPAQLDALNKLRWYSPGPAERARLKQTLGWRRKREETIALALELLAAGGLGRADVAKEIDVDARYLDRLLRESPTRQNGHKKTPVSRGVVGLTDKPKAFAPPRRPGRPTYDGDAFSYDLESALERVEAA